jgi:hypothetical protein
LGSTDWALAGPIIERERIGFKYTGTAMEFVAWVNGELSTMHDQLLMRCYLGERRCLMNWLKDFFFCNTWRELFVAIVVGAIGLFIFWFLIVAVFVLFG